MARLADRVPEDASGDLFVDSSCIACDTAMENAREEWADQRLWYAPEACPGSSGRPGRRRANPPFATAVVSVVSETASATTSTSRPASPQDRVDRSASAAASTGSPTFAMRSDAFSASVG